MSLRTMTIRVTAARWRRGRSEYRALLAEANQAWSFTSRKTLNAGATPCGSPGEIRDAFLPLMQVKGCNA